MESEDGQWMDEHDDADGVLDDGQQCSTQEDYEQLASTYQGSIGHSGGDEKSAPQASAVGAAQASAHLFVFSNEKAGMNGVDREHIDRVVYEASKNSAFYKHAQKQDAKNQARIDNARRKLAALGEDERRLVQARADEVLVKAERERMPRQVCCVVDLDAFYVNVEIRDNPSLRDKPVAVGGMGMICTANYAARKFGVRAAMPGFIGKKLCPALVFVPPDFEKYTKVATETREIFREYDGNFHAGSLDEAYLDLTDAVTRRLPASGQHAADDAAGSDNDDVYWETAASVVNEIRQRIKEKTKCTASGGYGTSFPLAKIGSDINKPDGQFGVPFRRTETLDFLRDLPVRKINGVGKVMERLLVEAMGIKTCGDLLDKRAILFHVFSVQMATWLLKRSIGLGDAHDDTTEPSGRKGMSRERTFPAIKEPVQLVRKLQELCDGLAEDLAEKSLAGRTLTLKLKDVDFNVRTRAHSTPTYISSSNELFDVTHKLLSAELPITVRLMGIRMTKFRGKVLGPGQRALDAYFTSKATEEGSEASSPGARKSSGSGGTASTAPATASDVSPAPTAEVAPSSSPAASTAAAATQSFAATTSKIECFTCPVCGKSWPEISHAHANRHVDDCLVSGGNGKAPGSSAPGPSSAVKTGKAGKKRGRGPAGSQAAGKLPRLEQFFCPKDFPRT